MKRIAAVLASLVLAISAGGVAVAGVVIDEQVTTHRGGSTVTQKRQVLVQGNKEKMVGEHNTFVIDLDKGMMTLIDPKQKVYAEMPFPPQGMSAPHGELGLNFKKTGKHSKLLGYGCQEYTSSGHTMMADISTRGCFSTSAPGAAEFTGFTRTMAKRLKKAKAMGSGMPQGIPLSMRSTRTFKTSFKMPGISPQQAKRLKEMLAKQSPEVTNTVVVKIATRKLPADTFTVPADYQRRGAPTEMMPQHGGAKSHGGGAPVKVPE